ncbi:MAG: ATP-binding protein [Chloroflexi bacterium]|nr:ATP-binding protein [Chloroflexota bacterium]MCY4246941.1 ATP-binding protein [Chloroflexota bacterium]
MSTKSNEILVTSHVSRDFEQSAAYFNTYEKVVWEYVSNSLDGAKDNQQVIVTVEVTRKKITVLDNGRGMSRGELSGFFQMHGENLHRQRGKATRGKFGTGKSAAFGVANRLTIDTVQNGLRNQVQLTRNDIKSANDGGAFPVTHLVSDERTDKIDGTEVTVSAFAGRSKPNVEKISRYVTRFLGRFRGRAQVRINGITCEFKEPAHEVLAEVFPPQHLQRHLGKVKLIIKKSQVPLQKELQGIDILSKGILHETTLVGIEDGEQAEYIFGEVDVPILEDGEWHIPPFDNTRSLQLNDQNPVVARLKGWLTQQLKDVHAQLVQEAEDKRRSEQAKRLRREAKRIRDILNDDFVEQELKLERARRATDSAGVKAVADTQGDDGLLPGEGEIPTDQQQAGNEHGEGNGGSEVGEGETPRPGPSLIGGEDKGRKTGQKEGRQRRRRGVFSLDYENASQEEARSRFDPESKTIWINLDHLQIAQALERSKGKTTGMQFREMSYEVAAVEYSLALEHVRVENDEANDPEDSLYNVRETIDRITRRLFSALSK